MNLIRRAILAFALIAGLSPAFAAAPPPVPALPDTERRTSYSITGTTCACNVNFALYGDSTDVDAWLEVWIAGVRYLSTDPTFGWTITSPTGSLATIPRPITDAVLTFTNVQTGIVQIVGAVRPRRTTQVSENKGVAARDFNLAITYIISSLREFWDKLNDVTGRALIGLPGENIGPLPSAAKRAGSLLAFDGSGNPVATTPGAGTGNVVGPGSSVNSDLACFNGVTGALLKDCGAIGNTTLTGDITGGPAIGTIPTTLATVNANVGIWGSTTALPTVTVDGKGRITAISNVTITPANIGAVPTTRNVQGGAGMTAGGALSSDVTLGLATIPNNTILANNSGITAAPGNLTPSQVLDMLGATQGQVLYRGASGWQILAPGTNGQLLTSGGAAANVSWSTASGTGTVTSVGPGTGITTSPNPIVGVGTVALTVPVTTPLGGTGVVSPTAKTVPINQGASAQTNAAITQGQCLSADGSGNPTAIAGCRVLLNTLTASNSATLSDTSSITSAFNDYEIVFENVLPATNNTGCEIQVHSGGSFQSTSYLTSVIQGNGSTAGGGAQTTYLACSGQAATVGNTGAGISGTFRVYGPVAGTSAPKQWTGQTSYVNASAFIALHGGYWNNTAAIDGFQVLMIAGNITSGTIKIYGLK